MKLGHDSNFRMDCCPVPRPPQDDSTSCRDHSRSMSTTPPIKLVAGGLLGELLSHKVFSNSLDDAVETRKRAIEEVRAIGTRIRELKNSITTAVSNPQPTGSAEEVPSYRYPISSHISSTELEVDIDHLNLALQNASLECLGAGSVAEDVEDESWSKYNDLYSGNAPPFAQIQPCDCCIAQNVLVCLSSEKHYRIQPAKVYSVLENCRAFPVKKMELHVLPI